MKYHYALVCVGRERHWLIYDKVDLDNMKPRIVFRFPANEGDLEPPAELKAEYERLNVVELGTPGKRKRPRLRRI